MNQAWEIAAGAADVTTVPRVMTRAAISQKNRTHLVGGFGAFFGFDFGDAAARIGTNPAFHLGLDALFATGHGPLFAESKDGLAGHSGIGWVTGMLAEGFSPPYARLLDIARHAW